MRGAYASRRAFPAGRARYNTVRSGDRATRALAVQALGGDGERVGRMAAQPPGLSVLASGRTSLGEAPRAEDRLTGLGELLVELAVHGAPFEGRWTESAREREKASRGGCSAPGGMPAAERLKR